MRQHKTWTPEEEYYLQNSWGLVSIHGIAKHLGRSIDAVKVRANRIGLGNMIYYGDYITLNQLLIAVKGTNAGGGYVLKSWVKERGLPVHRQKIINKYVRVVYLDEFWKWAEKNRSFIDFAKMEPLALGAEPDWVAQQRKLDFQGYAIQRKDPWTSEDDSRLIMLLKMHKYTYAELSDMLRRSSGAIQRRCCDLGIKERPVKASSNDTKNKWTDRDFEILANGIRNGECYSSIGKKIGKSDKAIRGKVYFVYLSEDADKVRAMMGDHPWGYGAPEPTVKQAIHLSRTRKETKAELSQICGVLAWLLTQKKKTDYDQYFQRAMCMQWDELNSICGAGCDDCDSCTEFIRIRPQYCTRCGGTFYERKENRVCPPCRVARKKQAQKKWAKLNKTNV